jgi:hypothetical protein
MTPPAPPSARCLLQHRAFSLFSSPVFRRAEADGMPAMVVSLGEREVAMPLRALQKELGIDDGSDDGRMLGLIAESLDYVTQLTPGDELPAEVLSGEASWQPEPEHMRLASMRVQAGLVAWLDSGAGSMALGTVRAGDGQHLTHLMETPALRQRVQMAFQQAARALGLDSPEAVVPLVEDLARELAFIEALRDRLLRRVEALPPRLESTALAWRGDSASLETMTQVRRLAERALGQIRGRFHELDAQTGEVLPALRNLESHRTFIRCTRDWLHRSRRAWDPILDAWDAPAAMQEEKLPRLLTRTYQFLAPRFMIVTEWLAITGPRPANLKAGDGRHAGMVW